MSINTYFTDFLSNIRLTATQKSESKRGHTLLRNNLLAFEGLKDIIVTTFLQGSYRRGTAVRPSGEKRADVDVIVVTNLDRFKVKPKDALEMFEPFVEKHYKDKWVRQGRSIGIELSYVDLDIVITSAPSEVEERILKSESVNSNYALDELSDRSYEWRLNKSWTDPDLTKAFVSLNESARTEAEWKTEPLWIPDRDAGTWETTDPLEQIRWTREKNKKTNGHYINVVKALKWWRIVKVTDVKYPKGYPIEHAIGVCCPDEIESIADGVTKTLEAFVTKYSSNRLLGVVPIFSDHGVPEHNVWHRITFEDFKKFYDHIKECAKAARAAYDTTTEKDQVGKWRDIFGDKFPKWDGEDDGDTRGTKPTPSGGGFSQNSGDADVKPTRFA